MQSWLFSLDAPVLLVSPTACRISSYDACAVAVTYLGAPVLLPHRPAARIERLLHAITSTPVGTPVLLIHRPTSRVQCCAAYSVDVVNPGSPVLLAVGPRRAFKFIGRMQSQLLVEAPMYCLSIGRRPEIDRMDGMQS